MDMPDTSEARGALERMAMLLRVLDREHTASELYTNLRGVRHELLTAQAALCGDEAASGSSSTTGRRIVLEMPHWAASRAFGTRPGSLRHQVLAALGSTGIGLTDHELAHRIRRPVYAASELRWEMVRAGWVEPWRKPEGLRIPPDTQFGACGADGAWRRRSGAANRPCRLWGITPAGQRALARLASGQMAFALGETA